MKKGLLLNQPLSAVIADMGHTDTLTVGDCGLPVPAGPLKIDLAVKPGLPDFNSTLETILTELCVEKVWIAEEMKTADPVRYQYIQEVFVTAEIEEVPHEVLKKYSEKSKAVVRTGECKAYANVILQSGVTF